MKTLLSLNNEFQNNLDSEYRREHGIYYTSEDNILKVIKPLFLDALHKEFAEVSIDFSKLILFYRKIANLKFLDPSCGCGNFLICIYCELRKIEDQILAKLHEFNPKYIPEYSISLSQLYGIELDTKSCEKAVNCLMQLKSSKDGGIPTIVNDNALRIEWGAVVPEKDLSYIVGNPPFVGHGSKIKTQKEDIALFFSYTKVDYACCWFKKAYLTMLKNKRIETAFVVTNSICQGEQLAILWKPLTDNGIHINFAYKDFLWSLDNKEAQVTCVVVGFSFIDRSYKVIRDSNGTLYNAKHINAYLIDAPNAYLENRTLPICKVPSMHGGNTFLDEGALQIEPEDLDKFVDFPYIKRVLGGKELLYGRERYCLWCVDAPKKEIFAHKEVSLKVKRCYQNRRSMGSTDIKKLKDTPWLYRENVTYNSYIAIPQVSCYGRKYIPIAYYGADFIPTSQVKIIANATLYEFGICACRLHYVWTSTVGSSIGTSRRYSEFIVYNNFPWPTVTEKQKKQVSILSQAILDIRKRHPDKCLAELYNIDTMPDDLREAHEELDKYVLSLYGLPETSTELDIIRHLFKCYRQLTKRPTLWG